MFLLPFSLIPSVSFYSTALVAFADYSAFYSTALVAFADHSMVLGTNVTTSPVFLSVSENASTIAMFLLPFSLIPSVSFYSTALVAFADYSGY
ncbi:hypothetical protein ACPS0O_20935 (plasmid) [Yersinia pestis]|uniref:hypothetical protein n=1 Tax=Yersinia pestis TaxID=632 RepID=UPI00402BF085